MSSRIKKEIQQIKVFFYFNILYRMKKIKRLVFKN